MLHTLQGMMQLHSALQVQTGKLLTDAHAEVPTHNPSSNAAADGASQLQRRCRLTVLCAPTPVPGRCCAGSPGHAGTSWLAAAWRWGQPHEHSAKQ
jgi:hypothetical protein